MDFEKPYGFTLDGWERLFEEDRLPVNRPVGIVLDEYAVSFIDRFTLEHVGYVRNENIK